MQKKEKKTKRIKKEKTNQDLKIFSPAGELLYIAKPGFCLDFQELIRQESKNRYKSNLKALKERN